MLKLNTTLVKMFGVYREIKIFNELLNSIKLIINNNIKFRKKGSNNCFISSRLVIIIMIIDYIYILKSKQYFIMKQ